MNESMMADMAEEANKNENSVELSAEEFFAKKWTEICGVESEGDMSDYEDYNKVFKAGVEKMAENIGFDLVVDKLQKELDRIKGRLEEGKSLGYVSKCLLGYLQDSIEMVKDWQEKGCQTLIAAIDVQGMKSELDELRQEGDTDEIAKKELEIVEKIQKAVRVYPQVKQTESGSKEDHPVEILKNQEFNCLGASMLGGYLLEKAGVEQLPAKVYHHMTTVIVTSDDKVHLSDMRFPILNKVLHDEDLKGGGVDEVLEFVENDKASLNLDLSDKYLKEVKSFWTDEPKSYLTIRKREIENQIGLVHNYLKTLSIEEGRDDAVREAIKYAESLDPDNPQNQYCKDILDKKKEEEKRG